MYYCKTPTSRGMLKEKEAMKGELDRRMVYGAYKLWGRRSQLSQLFPPQEFFLLMAIATAEAPTPNLLAISAIEIPISRFKKQAISALTFDTLRL